MEGEASIVLKDFLWLEAGGLGLQLNRAKCEVTGHTDATRAIYAEDSAVHGQRRAAALLSPSRSTSTHAST